MAELVARRYSQALFEVGKEENKLDEYLEEIKFIGDVCIEYKDFFELLKTPKISISEKKDVFEETFEGKISKEVSNFLKIILDKRRINNIFEITKEYEKLVDKHNGVVKADAYTTTPLEQETLKLLEEKLSKTTDKNVKLTNKIDETLIGGVKIILGDKVIDGTLKKKLTNIESSLKKLIV
ncbi:MAG: F0F1 ATP synthase subunit delta [Bacillota bacterium]|nr:F0F1 ATP synthase subunit delta [Bacillota bacterium]